MGSGARPPSCVSHRRAARQGLSERPVKVRVPQRPMDATCVSHLVRRPDRRRPADPDRASGGQVRSRSRRLRARADARRRDRRARRRAGELLRAGEVDRPADGNSPAFANVLAEPGTRSEKVRRQSRNLAEVTHQLGYLEQLYPTSIGEACFIDANGEEFARAVRGEIAKPEDLSTVGGADRLLRADLRAGLRAGSPDPAVRLAGHQGMGRRERDADPAGRRPQARVRALRGDRGELPPRDGREQGAKPARLRAAGHRRPHRQGRHRQQPPAARRRGARRPARRALRRARARTPEPAGVTEVAGHRDRLPPHRVDRGQRQRLDHRGQRQGADRQLPLGPRARCRSRCSRSRC